MKQSKRIINRDREILTLWRERPIEQQTEFDIMSLYSYIQRNQPNLLHGIHGDPYQYLMGLLRPYFCDKP